MSSPTDRRKVAVSRLPAAYALAVRLHEAGVPNPLIAAYLDVEEVTVRPLLIVAEAKIEAILQRSESG